MFDLTVAASSADATTLLQRGAYDALLVDLSLPGLTPGDLDFFRITAPNAIKALVGTPATALLAGRLSDATGQFAFLSSDQSADALAEDARRLLRPRVSNRLTFSGDSHRVRGVAGRTPFDYPLRDLSNRGLSFGVSPGELTQGLFPGAQIDGLAICDADGQILLEADRATVRHCRVDHADGVAFVRVGIAFDRPPSREAHVRVARGPLAVSAILQKAVPAQVPLTVTPPDSDGGYLFAEAKLVAANPPAIELVGPIPADVHIHDVVRVSFDHQGQSYSGMTSVTNASTALQIALPATLRVHHRRSSSRKLVTEDRPYSARIRVPLTNRDGTFPILDMNTTGISVLVDQDVHLFPPGLHIDRLEIIPPGEEEHFYCRGVVRALAPLPRAVGQTAGQPARCGIELVGLDATGASRLQHQLVSDGFAYVDVARPADYPDIWSFLNEAFKSHFYSDGTPESLAAVETAFEGLLRPTSTVSSTLLYRRDAKIYGHVLALRQYPRMWLATHFSARQGSVPQIERASRAMAMGVAEYIENRPDAEYFHYVWRRDQGFMNRVGGWSTRTIFRPGLSETYEFSHLVRSTATALPPPDLMVGYRDANSDDLGRVERYFLETQSYIKIRSRDLFARGLTMETLSRAYAESGMSRGRAVRMVLLNGEPVGFSLLEHATQALQLTEIPNSFDIFLFEGHDKSPQAADLKRALLSDAVDFYAKRGLRHAVVITEQTDLTPYQDAGFTVAALSYGCIFHRSLVRPWVDALDQAYSRGKELLGGVVR